MQCHIDASGPGPLAVAGDFHFEILQDGQMGWASFTGALGRSSKPFQPFLTSRSRNSRVCSQPGSFVPVSSQIFKGGLSPIQSTSRKIAKSSHQIEGDMTMSRVKASGYRIPIARVTRPPSDEPPKPVNSDPRFVRYFRSMNGLSSLIRKSPY